LLSRAAASTPANSIAPIAANAASCTRGPHSPISRTVGTMRLKIRLRNMFIASD